MVVAAFAEIFQVSFIFTYLEDGLQWFGCTFDPDFAVSEEKLLLEHVPFAPMGLYEDFLGHDVSSDGLVLGRPKAQPTYYSGLVPTYIYIYINIYSMIVGVTKFKPYMSLLITLKYVS